MSWHFSQVLVEEYLEENFLDGVRFAPWRKMPTAQDDSASDKMKGTCHRSPFGMMYIPSTDEIGGGLLTWFRAVFPVRISVASGAGKGITRGERSGLWKEMARIVRQVRPEYVFVENSPMLTSRGLSIVLGDLASMGFDARWGVLGAHHTGSDHLRKRIWIVANAGKVGRKRRRKDTCQEEVRKIETRSVEALRCHKVWTHIPSPDAFGNPVGLARRMDRLQAIGDGQVPRVVKLAWGILAI